MSMKPRADHGQLRQGKKEELSELDMIVEGMMAALDAHDLEHYSREVVAEFRHPANVGPMEDADGAGVADGLCTDSMHMWVRLSGGVVVGCTFYTDGCGAAIACGSRLTRLVTGRNLADAMSITSTDLTESLGGLPEDHTHCASLSVIAFRNAVRDATGKKTSGQEGTR